MSDGFLQVCPGTTVSLTCSHDSVADLSRWVISPALPMDCDNGITHTTTPNSEGVCGPFDVTMISARSEVTRRSTLELVITTSLNNIVVTCYAGASTSDPQVGNYTVQVIGEVPQKAAVLLIVVRDCNADSPSTPTTGSIVYSVTDTTTGLAIFEASSTGSFGTGVSYSGSVVGGGGSLSVDGNRFTVTGLSYTESHTVSVVATSALCPGVLNSANVAFMFDISSELPSLFLTSIGNDGEAKQAVARHYEGDVGRKPQIVIVNRTGCRFCRHKYSMMIDDN